MSIYQIELTNICNSACTWCNHRHMKRIKGYMTLETFKQVLSLLIKESPSKGAVGLHHFGEGLLHPDLPIFLKLLEENHIPWRLSTNGRLLTDAALRNMLLNFNGQLVISMENGADLESVKALIDEKKERDSKLQILLQTFGDTDMSGLPSGDYLIHTIVKHSWAAKGNGNYQNCCFLNRDWYCVLWDGTFVSCCMDMEGEAKLGDLKTGRIPNRPWKACFSCEVVEDWCPKGR